MGPGSAPWTALGTALGFARGKAAALRGCGHLWLGVWGSLRVPHRLSSVSVWGQLVPEKSPRGAPGNGSGSRQPKMSLVGVRGLADEYIDYLLDTGLTGIAQTRGSLERDGWNAMVTQPLSKDVLHVQCPGRARQGPASLGVGGACECSSPCFVAPSFLGKKRDCLFSGVFGGSGAGDGRGGEKLSLQDIAELIQTKACQRVVVMVGAGISTPSGIPDFRSPGSGLYSNLEQYDLPYPEAIFELDFFFHNPKPFFALAKELYPGNYRPNLAHYFLRLLHDKGLLLRLYTQNIDGLERAAGIPATKLVEAHGTFASATCTVCRKSFPGEEFRVDVMADRIPRCPVCTGVIKPDIIFFGEQLPQRFFLHMVDFPMADLLIIIGTSLEVEPFASLSEASRRSVPRVLINRELVGPFAWRPRHNDVAQLGDIIGGVERLVKALGWTKEIQDLMQRETSQDAL